MERFLITVYDLDDVMYYLLTTEEYTSLENDSLLEDLLVRGFMPGKLFESTIDLISYCVTYQVEIIDEESALFPR